MQPLILALDIDQFAFRLLNDLRQQHFPPARNFVPAHVTLFHHLPGNHEELLTRTLEEVCEEEAPFELATAELRFLGSGVAIALRSPELDRLRDQLARIWKPWLTPQDRQRFRPHVTIQNKVEAARARALHDELACSLAPFVMRARGLLLWRYLGGPWEAVRSFPFEGRSPPST